jgi:tetratricopeptide (TPR) repeat protein
MTGVSRLGGAIAVVVLWACGPGGGPEGAGDRSYAEGRYEEALAAYAPLAEAEPSARLWAKVGATALQVGRLREATAAYRSLAQIAPERADEAADGLDLVIVAAERRRDDAALAEAGPYGGPGGFRWAPRLT